MKHMVLHQETRRPIQDGDAGIVLTKDGGFFLFATGDIERDSLSDRQVDQAAILSAFKTTLSLPPVMEIIMRLANDKSIMTGLDLLEKEHRTAAN